LSPQASQRLEFLRVATDPGIARAGKLLIRDPLLAGNKFELLLEFDNRFLGLFVCTPPLAVQVPYLEFGFEKENTP